MQTKLTLTLDNDVIRRAKKYALSKKTSLSRLAQSYFSSLAGKTGSPAPLPPITASLAGMIRGSAPDDKKTLSDALAKKFL